MASLDLPAPAQGPVTDTAAAKLPGAAGYQKFTSQDELGHFLVEHYKIRIRGN